MDKDPNEITESKKKEAELRKLNRTLRALSNSNQAMMRARDEAEYLNDVCKIVVEDCGHAMVWIGFAEEDEGKSVRPAAYAGFEEGYLESLKITWADTERGRGPTGTAIRTGKPCRCRNMLTDPSFKPWREEAIKRGYASSIVLPLLAGDKAFGAINIYSREPDPFSEEEGKLLSELARDLAYGIHSIRLRAAHAKAEEALRKAHDEMEMRVRERTAELAWSTEALKAERQRFNDVLEMLPAYVVLLTPDYHVSFANRFFEERFGKSGGKRCFEYLFGRGDPCENCETYRVLKTNEPHHWEWTGPDVHHYDIFDFPFTDADGSSLIMEMGIDITERKQAEEALRLANAYNRSLIEAALDPLVTIGPDGKITDVNSATEAVTGRSRDELIGTDFSDYFTEPEKARAGYQQVFRDGLVRDYPLEIRHRDGRVTSVLYNASLYRDETGRVIGVFAAARDITARKEGLARAEFTNALLRLFSQTPARKEYLAAVVELIQTWSGCRNVGIRLLDEQGNIPYESYTGFSRDFWEKENWLSILGDQCACVRVVAQKTDPQDQRMMTPAGSFYCNHTQVFFAGLSEAEKARFRGECIRQGFLSLAVIPIQYRGKILGAIHIADEKEGKVPLKAVEFIETSSLIIGEAVYRFSVEDELRGQYNLMETVLETLPVGVWITDSKGKIILGNPEGNKIWAGSQYVGIENYGEYKGWRPDTGEQILPGEWAAARAVTRGETTVEEEIEIEVFDGTRKRILNSAVPLRNEKGEITGALVVNQDITERKKAEEGLIQAEKALVEAKRLSDVGALAASVAHELRNPLGVIQMAAYNLRKKSRDPVLERHLANIEKKVLESDQIINNLLGYSRIKTPLYQAVSIPDIVNECLAHTTKRFQDHKVAIHKDLKGVQGETIEVDPVQIKEVLNNLLANAYQALEEKKGRIQIRGIRTPEGGVEISILDNGTGIEKDDLERVFDPFFTRKTKGTGLGLSICQELVRLHGGRIEIESEKGKGTAVTVHLPRRKEEP